MKCQNLFSGTNKEKIIHLSSVEFAKKMVKDILRLIYSALEGPLTTKHI